MAPTSPNSPEVLCAEILAQARLIADQLVARAHQEAKSILAKAASDAQIARQQRLTQAESEATRQKEMILATIPVEAGRLRSSRIESVLQSIHEQIHHQLLSREGFDYRGTIIALAAGAARRMAGDAFVVSLSLADRGALGEKLSEEIAQRAGLSPQSITISEIPLTTSEGVIVQDTEGRQICDNRLSSRLERLWPNLRQGVAIQSGLVAGTQQRERKA